MRELRVFLVSSLRHFVIAAMAVSIVFAQCTLPASAAGGLYGNLRGTVVDDQSNAPVSGAQIVAASPSGTFRATTDAHGDFNLLQLPTDTYVVSIQKSGYLDVSVTGIPVFGDMSQTAGIIRISKGLKTIASVKSRSRNSAFQPTQTIDATTLVGARVNQAVGENGSTNFEQLAESAPGVVKVSPNMMTSGANTISIRGAMSSEIGYQFDGINIAGLVFDENQTMGYLNGIGGGRGALQVVSGAGDATQGGISGGVINVVPGRGTYPGSGFVSLDASGPWYDHSLAAQWGVGSPNGRFSEYLSMRSDRFAPQVAPYGRDAGDAGAYQSAGESNILSQAAYSSDDDVLNNFFYTFGKNNDQDIQLLTDLADHRAWNHYGGPLNIVGSQYGAFGCNSQMCNGYGNYYPWDQFDYNTYFRCDGQGSMWPGDNGTCSGPPPQSALSWYDQVIPWEQGIPMINNGTTPVPVTQPEQFDYGATSLTKLGYTRRFQDATLNLFYYNTGGQNERNIWNDSQGLTDASNIPGYGPEGGRRIGWQAQFVKQFGDRHTTTFLAKLENANPAIDQMSLANMWQGFNAQRNLTVGTCAPNTQQSFLPSTFTYCADQPGIEYWYVPQTLGSPVSAANPCMGPAPDNGYASGVATNTGCYIYDWLLANGKWNGMSSMPRIPDAGWNETNTDFQSYALALRDQWRVSQKLNVDWGARFDEEWMKWGANPFNADLSNPSDVGLSHSAMPKGFSNPSLVEPRLALSYQVDANNAISASYGRSVTFEFAQYAGTPGALQYVNPILYQIPAMDTASGLGPSCGSGWHGAGTNANGTYTQNPNAVFSGSALDSPNGQGWYFPCKNLAQQLFWLYDQAYSAPDMGGTFPPTYSNYDVAFSHQFKGGWGSRLTAYWRRGFNTFQNQILNQGQINPVTGTFSTGSFEDLETGQMKTFGMELNITAPERPYGFGGFLTANYINELSLTPPVAGSDSLPSSLPRWFLGQNSFYHVGFVSPLSATAGVEYKSRGGLRINPIFTFDDGYPFGVGKDALGFINGQLYHMPTGNLGFSTPYAGPGSPNQPANATCYDDPTYAGSYLNPVQYACRGYAEPALAGEKYTRPRLYSDLDLEYTRGKITYGLYVTNAFNNYRSEPAVNQDWQPVATGVGGAQSGQVASSYPFTSNGPNLGYVYGIARDMSQYDQPYLPFYEDYVPGRSYRAYMQIKL